MTINKVMSLATRDFTDAVRWAAKTSGGQIRVDIGKDDTVMYLSSFQDTNSSRARIEMKLTSGNPGDRTFVVSSGMLVNALKLIKGNEFTATLTSSTFVIKAGRSTVNFPIIKGGDEILVPPLPPLAGRVSVQDFKKAVSSVTLAASNDDTTVALMSIHCAFSPKNGTISFVATDRYKMMLRTIPYVPADDTVEDYSKNVMASSIKTLVSGLQNQDNTIDIHLTSEGSQFVIRDVGYMSGVGVIGGEFVKYENFLKLGFENKITVELAELKGAIDGIATLLTTEEGVTLSFTNDECSVSSVSNVGSTVCGVDATLPTDEEGEPTTMMVAFGSKYIRPVLSSLSSKVIELHYNKPTAPWVFKELDEDGTPIDSSFTLLMPMRV